MLNKYTLFLCILTNSLGKKCINLHFKCIIVVKSGCKWIKKSVKYIFYLAGFFHYKTILLTYLHDFSKRDEYLERAKQKYELMNAWEDMADLKNKIRKIEGNGL